MVSVILVSFNAWRATMACIESIRRNVSVPHEIIVVDNASSAETLSELKRRNDIKLICNSLNMGFPAACNIGLKHAGGDIIWFLNNDTIVPKHSLERMIELLLSDDGIGMVGPVTNRISGIQQIPVDYMDDAGIDGFASEVRLKYAGQTQRVIRLVGFSMLLRKRTLDELGGLDERMGIGTFEDDDLSLRLIANGYRLLVARDSFIHHVGNASFREAGGYPSTGDRNQRIVSMTYGMTVPDETMLNESLYGRLPLDCRSVLHVECGAGALGLSLMDAGKRAVGFESSAEKLKIASRHYLQCLRYERGADFHFNGDGFNALVVEKQLDERDTLSIVRSLKDALEAGAAVLVQAPFITGVDGEAFLTYLDGWRAEGAFPLRGVFRSGLFIDGMGELGFDLVTSGLADVRQGFFNRCAFTRHMESAGNDITYLDFFKSWTSEFVKL